jgi:hypothetical protein
MPSGFSSIVTPGCRSWRTPSWRSCGPAREHGVVSRVVDGVRVRLTTPSKTVADCFPFRRYVGLEVALEALRDFLRKRAGSVDAIVKAARAARI